MSAELFGSLEQVVSAAVRQHGTYKIRADGSARVFGGVNIVMCADLWQLHPVNGTFLAGDPLDRPSASVTHALRIWWGDGPNSIRSLCELKELMRCTDSWYNNFLGQCRIGDLSMEDYDYFHGLPTLASPGREGCSCNKYIKQDKLLGEYREDWQRLFLYEGADMKSLLESSSAECKTCKTERASRCRVINACSPLPSALQQEPFSSAPALYTFNVPRYRAIHLRAREFAKQKNVQLSWCYARDVPLLPEDRELPTERLHEKLFSWLSLHDQETQHIPSIYPLAVGMPVRVTENIDRNLLIYRGRKGKIYGWTESEDCIREECNGEFVLSQLPRAVYIRFDDASWTIGKLPQGVYPMKRNTRTWKVNRRTGVEARRTGFWLIPDFGSTAHMIQGATLEAAFVDLQDPTVTTGITSQIAAYVCLSRVKKMKSVCVMQPFSPFLFRHGNPAGPDRLLRKIRGEISAKQAFEEWAACSNEEVASASCDPLAQKHLCVSCYLKQKTTYMLNAADFGITDASTFHEKYTAQGRWTRCLHCIDDAKKGQTRHGSPGETVNPVDTEASEQQVDTLCPTCSQTSSVWKNVLYPGGHGCWVCKQVFPTKTWNECVIKNHRFLLKRRDLVCPACTNLGFSSGKYKEYECGYCLVKLGSDKFTTDQVRNKNKRPREPITCVDCKKNKVRCGVCKTAHSLDEWSRDGRKNIKYHSSTPVCKLCCEQGYSPANVEAYTCDECQRRGGVRWFGEDMLRNRRNHVKTKLKCLRCIEEEINAPIECQMCNTEYDADHWPKPQRERYALHKSRGARLTCRYCQAIGSPVQKNSPLECASCQSWFPWKHWPRQERDNHRNRGTLLVCRSCRSQGCQPQDVRRYKCWECKEQLGPLKFARHKIHKYNAGRNIAGGLKCEECSTKKECLKCCKLLSKSEFAKIRLNETEKKTGVLCADCKKLGYTPDNLVSIRCRSCKKEFGPLRFSENPSQAALGQNGTWMECTECAGTTEMKIKMLKSKLKTSRRKCNCGSRLHRDRCPLTPVRSGEKRWPGSDGAITAEEREFLDGLKPIPDWWDRAWQS